MKLTYESNYKTRVLRDDELMHWKYIKREKKNGRWVYYYDDSKLQDAKNKYNKAKQNYKTAENRQLVAEINYKSDKDHYLRLAKQKTFYTKKDSAYLWSKNADASWDKWREANAEYKKAGEAYTEANIKYKTMKVATLVPRTIAKGAVKVANWLSKLTAKKSKPKKSTSTSIKKSAQKQTGKLIKPTVRSIPKSVKQQSATTAKKSSQSTKVNKQKWTTDMEYWKELEYNSKKNRR